MPPHNHPHIHAKLRGLTAQLNRQRHWTRLALVNVRAQARAQDTRHRKFSHERFQRLSARLAHLNEKLAAGHDDARLREEEARYRALNARHAIEHALVDAGLSQNVSAQVFERVQTHLEDVALPSLA